LPGSWQSSPTLKFMQSRQMPPRWPGHAKPSPKQVSTATGSPSTTISTPSSTAGMVDLRFEGAVSGRLANASPQVELEFVEGDAGDDSSPSHYALRITTGQVVEQIRTIIILWRADLDAGTYPITQRVSEVFTPEAAVKASVIGAIGYNFDAAVSGEFTFERVDDTFSGSFVYTGSGGEGAALTVRGDFGPIMPSAPDENGTSEVDSTSSQ